MGVVSVPSGCGGEPWQGHACTLSASHGWMLQPSCKEWAREQYMVAPVPLASSSGRPTCCVVAVLAARRVAHLSQAVFPSSLFLLICESCSAWLMVCELSLTTGPGNSSGRAGSEVTGDTGRPWMSYLAWSPNTRGIPLNSDPWEHPWGQWVSLTGSGGFRAALLGTLLLGHVTSQKGCSCSCSQPCCSGYRVFLSVHPLLSWRSWPKTLMGTGPRTDPERSGSSLVPGAEPSVGHAMPSFPHCAFGKPQIQNLFCFISINQTPEETRLF